MSRGTRDSAEDVIRRAYAAFNRRDVDAATALMEPDVEWPNGMEGGVERGREAVRAYWLRQWGVIDPVVEPLSIERSPDGAWIVTVHQVVRSPDGVVLADRTIQPVYELRTGLIRRMKIVEPAG
jgi:hypothetical protein